MCYAVSSSLQYSVAVTQKPVQPPAKLSLRTSPSLLSTCAAPPPPPPATISRAHPQHAVLVPPLPRFHFFRPSFISKQSHAALVSIPGPACQAPATNIQHSKHCPQAPPPQEPGHHLFEIPPSCSWIPAPPFLNTPHLSKLSQVSNPLPSLYLLKHEGEAC